MTEMPTGSTGAPAAHEPVRLARGWVRVALVAVGVVYAVPGLLLGMGVSAAGEAAGWLDGPQGRRVGLGVAALVAVAAMVRGAMVRAEAGVYGLVVVNRWRSRRIPWAELSKIRRGDSAAYSVAELLRSLSRLSDPDPGNMMYHALSSSVLVAERRRADHGAALPMIVLASLFTSNHHPAMLRFLEAAASRGADIDIVDG